MNVTDVATIAGIDAALFIDGNKIKKFTYGQQIAALSLPAEFVNPPHVIATAPDDQMIIAVCDSAPYGGVVWASYDGGATWDNIGAPKPCIATVTDIAITPPMNIGGRYIIVTIADNRAKNCQLGDVVMSLQPGAWSSIKPFDPDPASAVADYDFMAIQASPRFPDDRTVCTVGISQSRDIYFHVIKILPGLPHRRVKIATVAGNDYDYAVPPSGNTIIHAELALEPQFDGDDQSTQVAFVSITCNSFKSCDGVYRIKNNTVEKLRFPRPSNTPLIWRNKVRSIDYDTGFLVAGAAETAAIAYSSNPLGGRVNWSLSAIPANCGEEAIVRLGALPVCYAGTGSEIYRLPSFPPNRRTPRGRGAFLRSCDSCMSFT